MIAEALVAFTIRPTRPVTTSPVWRLPLRCNYVIYIPVEKNRGRDPHGKHITYITLRPCDQ